LVSLILLEVYLPIQLPIFKTGWVTRKL
jgi:hypothetical protein